MSIVLTEVESIRGEGTRIIFLRCQDSTGAWHRSAPIVTDDPNFDIEARKVIFADKVAAALADAELNELID